MEFNDIYWLAWLLLLFLPYEVYGAFSEKKGDTLSENVWDWFAVKNKQAKYGRARRFILLGFLVTLSFHFVYATSPAWMILFAVGMAASIAYHYAAERKH
jgi:hypothetical protein